LPYPPIIYVGLKTGRDGIHGATFASEELTEESESKRPSVQTISDEDEVKPAAPISCIPTSSSKVIASNVASISFLPTNGSPICTRW
jgi:hypothetical protein